MRNILFYSDMAGFGGHEIMAVEIMRALTSAGLFNVSMACPEANTRLREALTGSGIGLYTLPFSAVPRDYAISPLIVSRRRAVRELLRSASPDTVVCVQPRVELCTLPARIARGMQIPAVSYVPFAHPPDDALEGRFRAGFRRRVLRRLYGLFDHYITITEAARRDIVAQSPRARVEVVDNAVRFISPAPISATQARSMLGLPLDGPLLGVVGRIDFKQKGQDLAVRAFEQLRPADDARLVIVGSGEPDASHLRMLISQSKLRERIQLISWTSDMPVVYAALDCLLLPSRFEGMPLVMLEALLCGTPVAATNRDGMSELLPPQWLFDRSQPHQIREALRQALLPESAETVRQLQATIKQRFSGGASLAARFTAAMDALQTNISP